VSEPSSHSNEGCIDRVLPCTPSPQSPAWTLVGYLVVNGVWIGVGCVFFPEFRHCLPLFTLVLTVCSCFLSWATPLVATIVANRAETWCCHRWLLRHLAKLVTDAGVWLFMVALVIIFIRSVARWLVFPGCTPYLLRQTDVELSVRLRKRLERGYSRVLALIHVTSFS
jgi:hypothetical protein